MTSTLVRLFVTAVAFLAAAVVIAGCGGGDDDESVPAPLESALRFLPEDAAVLAVVPTDVDSGPIKQLDDLASGKVKGWDRIKKQIQDEVTSSASSDEVDALLGNPLAVAQSGPDSDDQYIALQVQDAATVKQSAQADIAKGEARELPAYQGAFLWEDTDDQSDDPDDTETNFNALKGNVIVGAVSEELLKQALDNAGGDDNMASNNDFKAKLNELGQGSLTRVVGDAQQLLTNAGEDSDEARDVKFVKSMGMFYGKTTVTSDGIQSESTLETDNESLSEDERPFPAGGAQLTLPEGDAIAGVALADPDHIVNFAESTAKQTSPEEFGQYELGLEQLKSTGGVDLHADLLQQMEQLSVTAMRGNNFEFQAKLKDGQAVQESLTSAQTFLQGAIGSIEDGLTLSIEGSSSSPTYVVDQGRREVARFAVKGDALVGSIGPSGTLPSPTASVPIEGATGALGLQVDLAGVTDLPGVEDEIDEPLARDVLASLGTVTQSISETEDAITEKSKLTIE